MLYSTPFGAFTRVKVIRSRLRDHSEPCLGAADSSVPLEGRDWTIVPVSLDSDRGSGLDS